jgi:hypothetical protein
MFGHRTEMVAYEIHQPLPCDEELWSATSGVEVRRLETSLEAKGAKPIPFVEGLQRTINGHEVRTNSFGRTILMAGVLNICWHLKNRELQMSTLSSSHVFGERSKWRGPLTRAFDHWKQDFDRSLAGRIGSSPSPYNYTRPEDNVVFESKTVLHHLAHMAMYVDIVDCQKFAGASRVLGRPIRAHDRSKVQLRMRDQWARTEGARDATYYAIRFLSAVLMSDRSMHRLSYGDATQPYEYSARDDVLFNRPWVLYSAALILWSYGFALEGPVSQLPPLGTHDEQLRDMRSFLKDLSSIRSTSDLKVRKGLNRCSGLLMVLRSTFQKTRWQLLEEAAKLLSNCIQALSGGGSNLALVSSNAK